MSEVIVLESENGLEREVYTFRLLDSLSMIDAIVVLDGYRQESRETKRHKWSSYASYSRVGGRDCKIKKGPKIPDWVVTRALDAIRGRIVFKSSEEN